MGLKSGEWPRGLALFRVVSDGDLGCGEGSGLVGGGVKRGPGRSPGGYRVSRRRWASRLSFLESARRDKPVGGISAPEALWRPVAESIHY